MMESAFNKETFCILRMQHFSCVILSIAFVFSVSILGQTSAFSNGTLPPSALEEFPGLDSRLVGIPIVKKDNTAALVAFSEAVNQLRSLESESTTLSSDLEVLKPELIRAQSISKDREEDLNILRASYKSLVINQYQELSVTRGQSQRNSDSEQLRVNHQSITASDSIRKWKTKAEKKAEEANKYVAKVEEKIKTSTDRIATIKQDIGIAKKKVKDRKAAARSAIPVALIESLEIPVLTMDAYLKTEQIMAVKKPECGLTWWALAGIGRAESNHGMFRGSALDKNGTVSPPIIGVALNGDGFAAIGDSDGGLLDGDIEWDRAVGVMQFIPGTWKGYGEDGNGDGLIDPQNVYDSALAAGKLLCANARPDMKTPEGRRTAFLRYNNSKKYADFVEAKGKFYEATGAGRFNPAPAIQ